MSSEREAVVPAIALEYYGFLSLLFFLSFPSVPSSQGDKGQRGTDGIDGRKVSKVQPSDVYILLLSDVSGFCFLDVFVCFPL